MAREHPHLRAAFDNCRQLLEASGLNDTEVEQRLAAVRAETASATEADGNGPR
ncbi:MAG: hypothetical protein ABSA52_25345 [Candidatus Binatia bacterium]|jgi:hypothetical protein